MNKQCNNLKDMHTFVLLWATQSLSTLGSSMTSYALVIWAYGQTGSALTTSLLAVCSYAPYVLLSIFAGALSDRWNKKITMLVCDTFAAFCTSIVLILLIYGRLKIWHLYFLNGLNGLMNTVQQPASDVAVSLLSSENQYQQISGMRSFSNSLTTILSPVLATMLISLWGMKAVIAFDMVTFAIAFITLAFGIHIPEYASSGSKTESLLSSAKDGIAYLKDNRGILDLILFLAGINLIASIYNTALPAMLLSRNGGGKDVLAAVSACEGLANVAGSIIVSLAAAPKNRVRVICNSLLFAMSTENFMLAMGRTPVIWCAGAVLGWLFIPVMNANMDVILRSHIPIEIQGRVYSVRNSLQFFTIPIGYLLGGILIDKVMEPFMAGQSIPGLLAMLFGSGKGSGAAMLYFILGFAGIAVCMLLRNDKNIWKLNDEK